MRTPYLPSLSYPFSLSSVMLSLSLAACGGSPAAEGSPLVAVTVVASEPGGTVVSEPVGLFCGSTCTASFTAGTTLRLSATPPPGLEVAGWQGACQGTDASCQFTVSAPAQIQVQYRKVVPTQSLLVTRSGSGSGAVRGDGGLDCGATCSARLPVGSPVTLTVAPDDVSTFTGWSGACTGTALSCSFTLSSDSAINASFGKPRSCAQVKDSHPPATDGPFKLFADGDPAKPWSAYCAFTSPPTTYLPLVNVTTGNFSQYTAGGGRPGNTVRTTFQRVRIDPDTLLVHVADLTYSLSAGLIVNPDGSKITQMNYGSASDCVATNSMSGVGNIDLGGTAFAVAPNAFVVSGYIAAGGATYSADSRSVDLRGGGFCGGIAVRSGPSSPFNLQLIYKP